MKLTPVLSANWDDERPWTISRATAVTTPAARKALTTMEPDAVIAMVKDSGLRGRGGAGFPTGIKWGFIPQGDGKPHYLVVNADESEPGTCKDMPLMLANPHVLVEGVVITCFAIRSNTAFIYVRGEVLHIVRRLQAAVAEAYAAGLLGKNIFGSGFDLDVVVHAGAGAYICGEETALLDSLEGFRGQPRLRPPFPAVDGLYASPTVVNNVESIASVPADHRPRRRLVPGVRLREVARLHALLAVRSRHPTRPVRSAARRHPARAARARRRRARRARAEVLDAGRIVDAAAHRRAPRRAAGLRGHGRRRLDARHEGVADLRRHHLRGPRRAAMDRVLRARVVRQVHAVPRGHLLDGADPASGSRPATPTPRTSTRCSTPATTSSAGRSARSATAPSARSPRRCSTSATSTSRTGRTAAARSTRRRPPCSRRPEPRHDDHLARVRGRGRRLRSRLINATIDGIAISGPQGHPDHPRRRASSASRSRASATTRCSTRSVPAGSASSRSRGSASRSPSCTVDRHRRAWSIKTQLTSAGRGEGAGGQPRVPAAQPPARLPGLRQGRRVPAAEPDAGQRRRREPVQRRQAHVREADRDLLAGAARPRALRAVRALHAVLAADRRRPVHRAVRARRARAGRRSIEDEPFSSYFSGNTVQICPVGALTGTQYRFRARPFDLVSTPSRSASTARPAASSAPTGVAARCCAGWPARTPRSTRSGTATRAAGRSSTPPRATGSPRRWSATQTATSSRRPGPRRSTRAAAGLARAARSRPGCSPAAG